MRATLSLSILCLFALNACAPAKRSNSGGKTMTFEGSRPDFSIKAPEISANSDWRPETVEVDCAAAKCPLQVGVLLFAGAPEGGRIPIHRCTAFLVAPDMVMSNGHCDFFGKSRGFFVSQKVNGEKSLREITSVPYKRYTPHPESAEKSSGRPDVALFKLDKPITNMPPLRLASGPQVKFEKLIAFSIFNGKDADHVNVESRECLVRRHEGDFPFDILEAPDVIHSYDCKLGHGTSGSPMFAPGNEEVQSVQMGGSDLALLAEKTRKELGRELFAHEKHWSSISSNVRCLDLPDAKSISCAVADLAETTKRFDAYQQREMNKLNSRQFTNASRFEMQFKPYRYQLKSADLQFEMVHIPACRVNGVQLKIAPVVIEQVRLAFNEWAELKLESLKTQVLSATVKTVQGDIHQLELSSWPAPVGEYRQADLDLRKQWGNVFNIDIPVCPR